jgi:hypothetical protein
VSEWGEGWGGKGGNEFSITTYKRAGNSTGLKCLRRDARARRRLQRRAAPEKISKLNFGISARGFNADK